ncbi:DNA primase family protein [Aerococcus urinaeequi]
MFKIASSRNLKLIQQFSCGEVELCIEQIEDSDRYEDFVEEVKKSNLNPFNLLDELNTQYISRIPIVQLIGKEGIEFKSKDVSEIPISLVEVFDDLMLDVGRKAIGHKESKSGRISFNHKDFAETVMKFYSLTVDRKDPETLLIYNKKKGYWEDATQPLHRLIIEIAHASGANIEDNWNVYIEKSIVDILKRKVSFIESANFNKEYFPLGNICLNSITGELVSHSPKHLATFGSSVNYKSDAGCPAFKQFLNELFEDKKTIDFIQEWFGYVLSNSHKANAFLIGVGSGANGKSTLFDVLAQLVGIQNVSSAPLSNFNSEFGLEPLIGKKLNLATESDVDAFKTGKLKALTAGEDISVNRKNKQEVTITLPTKLVFLMNDLPLLNDDSFGFERRLTILPFEKTFLPHEQDKELPKKLSNELEGILKWSLDGLRRLIHNDYNFTVSQTMYDEKIKYFGVGNPVAGFIEDCIVAKPAHVIDSTELLNAYKIWMMDQKLPYKGTDSPQKFWKVFKDAMDVELIEYTRGKSNGRTVVRDIALK